MDDGFTDEAEEVQWYNNHVKGGVSFEDSSIGYFIGRGAKIFLRF